MWEVHVLRQLKGHPNIVTLCDVIELADAVYIVMERIEGPDLQDYIHSQPGGALPEPLARTFFRHLLAALRHAHCRGFIHGDLKPANVRLHEEQGGEMVAVLVDWGLSRQIDQQAGLHTMMGTPAYAAPEQLTGYNADQAWGRARLGPPADVWALGAALYEMLAGHVPFGGGSHEELVANALALNYDTRPDSLSLEARQLIDAMLQVLPSDRARIDELCTDTWTLRNGPMPPVADGVAVEFDGAHEFGGGGGGGGMLARLCPGRRAVHLGYAALVAGALLYGATHGVGLTPVELAEDV
eukprot:7128641-Prymnesium_polylepis.1